MSRKPYPSDVSDDEWAFIAPYLTLMSEDAPQREHSLREVFNGLRWMVRAGASWRMMPNDLPSWFTVFQQTQRWIRAGVFEAVVSDLREVLRIADGRSAKPGDDLHPELCSLVVGCPDAKHFFQALQVDAECQVNGFVPHAAAALYFHLKRVQIENRINRIERARLPGANLIENGISYVGNQTGRNIDAVNLFQMTLNLSSGHPSCIQGDNLFVQTVETLLILFNQLRFKLGIAPPSALLFPFARACP